LLTFTCSQHVDAELFRKTAAAAAADARREVQPLQTLGPGPDTSSHHRSILHLSETQITRELFGGRRLAAALLMGAVASHPPKAGASPALQSCPTRRAL
jgi:hypothetical protein